jgi:hypothetical protein
MALRLLSQSDQCPKSTGFRFINRDWAAVSPYRPFAALLRAAREHSVDLRSYAKSRRLFIALT